jgi:hypothetical protein
MGLFSKIKKMHKKVLKKAVSKGPAGKLLGVGKDKKKPAPVSTTKPARVGDVAGMPKPTPTGNKPTRVNTGERLPPNMGSRRPRGPREP